MWFHSWCGSGYYFVTIIQTEQAEAIFIWSMWLEIFVTYYDRRIKGLIKMLHPTEKVISLVKYACKCILKTPSHEWVQNFPNLKEKSSCNKHFDWLPVLITQILNKIFRFAIDNCKTKKESNECNGTIYLFVIPVNCYCT